MKTGNSPGGLAELASVTLWSEHEAELRALEARVRGPSYWRKRKVSEIRDLLALSQIADRLRIEMLDAVTDIRAVLRLRCPVPTLVTPEEGLVVREAAVLGVTYPEKAIREPVPGFAFVQILAPRNVWLAVVSRDEFQALCLGTTLPVGMPLKEIVLSAFCALSMQTVNVDQQDPAGVMHAPAAIWWQQHPDLYPLTDLPFLAGDEVPA